MLNISKAGQAVGLDSSTANRYATLLEAAFMIQRLPAWGTTLGKRIEQHLTPMLAEATAADGDPGRTHAHGTGNGRSGDDVAFVSTRLVPLAEDSCVSRTLGTSR